MKNFIGPEMLLRIPALLLSITVHEYAHAKVSYKLGDPTPRFTGRLSLNPLAHLDPIGLLMLWIFKLGWAKPVQVNPNYYNEPKKGIILVSSAGPLANIFLAFLTLLLLKINIFKIGVFQYFFYILFIYNIGLAVFNLIPIPPLDGSKILLNVLPNNIAYKLLRVGEYGPIILIFLLYFNFLNIILDPMIVFLYNGLDTLTELILFRI